MKPSVGFMILIIGAVGLLMHDLRYQTQVAKDELTIQSLKAELTNRSNGSQPVYKLVGRMDYFISNPASTAYVFERAGVREYVTADKIKVLRPGSGQVMTDFYVKNADGTYYPLLVEKN